MISFHPRNIAFARQYSTPVSNKYTALKTPLALWWAKRVPPIAKYSGAILSAALALTHVHPNVLGTVAPPVLLATFYANRKLEHANYKQSLSLVQEGSHVTWRIKAYDESSLENVKQGIETEYDHFKKQVSSHLEAEMIDAIVKDNGQSAWTKNILDGNKQVVFQLGAPETFVNSKAERDEAIVQFISLSIPYYSSGLNDKKRLGVVQISMLEQESGEAYVDYTVGAKIWPYSFKSTAEKIC